MSLENRLLHRDGLILIIDKPAGIPVHAGPGGGSSLEDDFASLQFGLPKPPFLAHRLDRDTSGCLVLGRHPKALRKLGKLFSEGRAEKTYWAICVGVPTQKSGRIDFAIDKINRKSGWKMELREDGKPTVTEYKVLGEKDGLSFIECYPKTGRTHQIRVHLAAIGCPILGDPIYGEMSAAQRAQPMMLHARAIKLPLQASKPPIYVEAEPPEVMAGFITKIT